MKREFLEGLKLEADVIDKIMAENGKDVNREKAKFADYDELKAQLEAANKTLDGFKDYEAVKADVEKYKAESERITIIVFRQQREYLCRRQKAYATGGCPYGRHAERQRRRQSSGTRCYGFTARKVMRT